MSSSITVLKLRDITLGPALGALVNRLGLCVALEDVELWRISFQAEEEWSPSARTSEVILSHLFSLVVDRLDGPDSTALLEALNTPNCKTFAFGPGSEIGFSQSVTHAWLRTVTPLLDSAMEAWTRGITRGKIVGSSGDCTSQLKNGGDDPYFTTSTTKRDYRTAIEWLPTFFAPHDLDLELDIDFSNGGTGQGILPVFACPHMVKRLVVWNFPDDEDFFPKYLCTPQLDEFGTKSWILPCLETFHAFNLHPTFTHVADEVVLLRFAQARGVNGDEADHAGVKVEPLTSLTIHVAIPKGDDAS